MLKFKTNLIFINNHWEYNIKFEDNPYLMRYRNKDIIECQKIQSIIDKRILDFLKHKTNILKTSDLNLEYILIK